jgi:DNA repair exonuclease SbcCD nuclease subunit
VRPARLLHTADVHLGNSGTGPDSPEAVAFSRAVDLAIDVDVDAVLIVGDLFDHGRVSEDLLAWTAKELDRAERPVVLMVGNHDVLNDASVHHRFRGPERCAEVTLLDDPDGTIVEVPGTDVVVWGRAMQEHEPRYRPLAGVPPKPEGRWGIAAGHGVLTRGDRPSHHASPISMAEIEAIDWDYVALGHYHGHKVLREPPRPALYPGATAYSRRGEAGVVMVDFWPGRGVTYEWNPLGPV